MFPAASGAETSLMVSVGASFTVKVKFWVALLPTPLLAVMVIG
jgi:hypothetical protein